MMISRGSQVGPQVGPSGSLTRELVPSKRVGPSPPLPSGGTHLRGPTRQWVPHNRDPPTQEAGP
jgi:hypothetical protein